MKTFASASQVIVDLGMNNGDDTDYYLKKGYRVLSVDANPRLCARARERFADAVRERRLIIVNAAIWSQATTQPFYVNLDNDHWSSLDPAWAGRENSRTQALEVDCIPIAHLFARYGVPFYLKIDVEGADELVLDSLAELPELPFYLSLEDCRFGYRYMEKLAALGYRSFQLLDQSLVDRCVDTSIEHRFRPGSSGPFGPQLPGEWLGHAQIEEHYSREVRDRQGNRQAPRTRWWDIHCRASAAVVAAREAALQEG